MENYIVINGKKVELTQEQLRALGIKIGSPFEKEEGECYWAIDSYFGALKSAKDVGSYLDDYRYQTANYCTDEKMMAQQARRETLSRLLWRYSMEHDGDKIDLGNENAIKWTITINSSSQGAPIFCTEWYRTGCLITAVYFYSEEIAQQAIREVVEPFLEKHPDFVV